MTEPRRPRTRGALAPAEGRLPRARGAAIPLVLVLLVALTALAHGALLVALEEESASRASAAMVQARVMAEGAVRRAVRDAVEDTLPDLPGDGWVLEEGSSPDAGFRAELRRVSREVYWVEGVGRAALAPGGLRRVEERTARLLWALAPDERIAAFTAAVEHGDGLEAPDPGAVDSWGAREAGTAPAPIGCHDRRGVLDAALAGVLLLPSARVSFVTPEGLPELGLLTHDSLLARVEARVSGTVEPRPVEEGGRCATDARLNWGSPTDPDGPCAGHRPPAAAEGDLTLRGGEGQGLLLVAGDLRLTAGASYAGLVLVGGDLTVDEGAELEGLARVRGSVRVGAGGRLSGALCPALLALESAPALRRPLGLPGGGWIRPF